MTAFPNLREAFEAAGTLVGLAASAIGMTGWVSEPSPRMLSACTIAAGVAALVAANLGGLGLQP